jgi:hypothetical protein
MPWLLVNPGSPEAWTIELKPGSNSFGRSNANDFQLNDPSVSGCHCQIVVDDANIRIKDLGSTNGTYVNQAPVQEAALRIGQTIHLGSVEVILCAEAPKGEACHPVRPAPAAPTVHHRSPAAGHITSSTLALPVSVPSLAAGSQVCKFHPRTPARFLCDQCHRFYCELCVNTRGRQEFCRTCGVECVPVQVQIQLPPPPKGFYARLPGAFVFPFRGSGVLVLIVGTILLALIKAGGGMGGPGFRAGMSFGWWGLMARVIVLGYLFTYMQSLIHSTALEEEKMPPLPDITNFWEDILLPCLQLIGLTLISFAPAIAVGCWVIATEQESMGVLLLAAFILGCLYFPMAFLAVAMLDCVAAAHPLQVIPSIFKVPREYLVAILTLAGVLGVRALGDVTLHMLFPRGLATRSISQLLQMFAAQAFWSLVSLYLLTVGMRILGLLYVTKKDKLGWYNR